MEPLKLNEVQQELQSSLVALCEEVKKMSRFPGSNIPKATMDEMADKALKLHVSLAGQGKTPQYTQRMIENRKISDDADPGTREFYYHLHPVEDLLEWLLNPRTDLDPVDQSMNKEFEVNIYTRRSSHTDVHRIKRTPHGWAIDDIPCDKGGRSALYEILNQDLVEYPADLPSRLEWLWNTAREEGLSIEEVHKRLNELFLWLQVIEEKKPSGDLWGGYST